VRFAVWWVEWRLAGARLRRFLVGAIVLFALVLVVATGALGQAHAATAYVLIFTGWALVGSAVPLRWEGERGMALRIVAGGVAPWSYLLQRSAAAATIDVVQLVPSLSVVAVAAGASPVEGIFALGVLALSVWVGGLVGVLLAASGRSLFETAVLALLATVVLGHASGAFRSPQPGSLAALVENVAPFRALHETLFALTSGVPGNGGMALLAWAVALPGLVALSASGVHRALTRLEGGGLEGV
jgi:hypothetical protein